jgi:hypothetical protein
LKDVHGLPVNTLRAGLPPFAPLTVSEGALAPALQRLARGLPVEPPTRLDAIRTSPAPPVDETGWTLRGVNPWRGAFVPDPLASVRLDRRRGAGVPKDVLGVDGPGLVIRDGDSADNRLKSPQQKCRVRRLRELRDGAKTARSEAYRRAHRHRRRVCLDARRLARSRGPLPPRPHRRRQRRLEARLFAWGATPSRHKTLRRLAGRILRHPQQRLTCLHVAGLP